MPQTSMRLARPVRVASCGRTGPEAGLGALGRDVLPGTARRRRGPCRGRRSGDDAANGGGGCEHRIGVLKRAHSGSRISGPVAGPVEAGDNPGNGGIGRNGHAGRSRAATASRHKGIAAPSRVPSATGATANTSPWPSRRPRRPAAARERSARIRRRRAYRPSATTLCRRSGRLRPRSRPARTTAATSWHHDSSNPSPLLRQLAERGAISSVETVARI